MTTRICSIGECAKPVKARGWCAGHYYRWSAHGDPNGSAYIPKECSIEGCARLSYSRTWCSLHYNRWLVNGDENWEPESVEERFWNYVEKTDSCWNWVGAKSQGYGVINVRGRVERTHRFAWSLLKEPLSENDVLDHRCHNRACCNVGHLRLVTHQQNNFNRSGPQIQSSSGVRNVYPIKTGWHVKVQKDGKSTGFGVYKSIKEAAEVAEQARRKLFGEFAGKG